MIMSACSQPSRPKENEKPLSVTTYSPSRQQEQAAYVSGVVASQQAVHISTRLMGYIDRIYVKQGDQVKQGQLLVSLNSDDVKAKQAQVQAMIGEAEAASRSAHKDLERYQTLHAQKSVSDKELENMQLRQQSVDAKLQMARQSLREVNTMFSYAHIRAPFSGVITQKWMDEGSTASPGMPILTLEQSGALEVKASVSENYISQLTVGMPVKVEVKALRTTLDGQISELSPSAENTGGQYAMRVALDAAQSAPLKAGMYASVQLPVNGETTHTEGLWVETSSLVQREQLRGVYVATGNKAMLRWLRLGKEENGRVEVLAGLSSTDKVIRPTGAKLYNGRTIQLTK